MQSFSTIICNFSAKIFDFIEKVVIGFHALDDALGSGVGIAAAGVGYADGAELWGGEDADGVNRAVVQAAGDDSDFGDARIEVLEGFGGRC